MASEATHIRFALDTIDFFEVDVESVSKYISGSIYPDSRYLTNIDRILTHNDNQMAREFWKKDDFRKGWACHILYDKILTLVHTDWFKDLLKEGNPEMTDDEDKIVRTALKVLQDINDLQHFDIKSYLNALDYIETPNGEDKSKVREYNQLCIGIYNNAPDVSIKNLKKMWIDCNTSTEVATRIYNKAHEIQKDVLLMKMISEIYDETIARKEEFFKRYCI